MNKKGFFIEREEIKNQFRTMKATYNRASSLITSTESWIAAEKSGLFRNAAKKYAALESVTKFLHETCGIEITIFTAQNSEFYSDIDKKTYFPTAYVIVTGIEIDWYGDGSEVEELD